MEIGSYFELELPKLNEYHKNLIKLNSGRNAFKYILLSQGILKVYVPSFFCNTMIESLDSINVDYEFYEIDNNFEIIDCPKVSHLEKIIYVNYFGLKNNYINTLINLFSDKLIIDNTQAFFELPKKNIDTIYSARKFFGVSDGGYLHTNDHLDYELERDTSVKRVTHLLGKIDKGSNDYYNNYLEVEDSLNYENIKIMSFLTERILQSIDYKKVYTIRYENFWYLNTYLKKYNQLSFEDINLSVPFVYPFMVNNATMVRETLIKNKIYVSLLWKNVLDDNIASDVEKKFAKNIIPLPIDQRYGIKEMDLIIKIINKMFKG